MFSQIGWIEILIVLIIGLIVIGPERLPELIKDVRATALAFRNLVRDARRQLDEDLGPEFEEFRKPLQDLNSVRQMGARGFITKTLFDDDDSFLTSLDETGRDMKRSVDSVRDSAAGKNAGARPSDVEAHQQADLGESRDPASRRPIQPEARDTAPVDSETAPNSEPESQLPRTNPVPSQEPRQSNPWDDVL